MDWLTKILKGSGHKISEGQYHGRYGMTEFGKSRQLLWYDFDHDDLAVAMARSLEDYPEEDQKGKKVVGKSHGYRVLRIVEETKCNRIEYKYFSCVSVCFGSSKLFLADSSSTLILVVFFFFSIYLLDTESQLEEDEQLARALQESLNVESPPRHDAGNIFQPFPSFFHLVIGGVRICAGCNCEIGHGRYLSCMGAVWHPECFRCRACGLPILNMSFLCPEVTLITNHATRNKIIQNVMFAGTLFASNKNDRVGIPGWRRMGMVFGIFAFFKGFHDWELEAVGTLFGPIHEVTVQGSDMDRLMWREEENRSLSIKSCYYSLSAEFFEKFPAKGFLCFLDPVNGYSLPPLLSFDWIGYLVLVLVKYIFLADTSITQIPTNAAGLIEYRAHPFWMQKYCPSHEHDGTPRCCSCERMEGHHHLPETRDSACPKNRLLALIGTGYRIIDMMTEPYRLIRRCEVTAILILYGLPRLLTGSILAHEMMHAWLRLKGYPNLSQDVEEGICQVLAYMWLDSEIYSSAGSDVARLLLLLHHHHHHHHHPHPQHQRRVHGLSLRRNLCAQDRPYLSQGKMGAPGKRQNGWAKQPYHGEAAFYGTNYFLRVSGRLSTQLFNLSLLTLPSSHFWDRPDSILSADSYRSAISRDRWGWHNLGEPSISEHGRMKFTLQGAPTDFDDQDIAVAIVRSIEDYEAEEDKKLKKLVGA
ncbi:Protein DA1-related 1 [Vitis vinifera]|uniref:Protein DA1-related 1 n=1 Tax=Vitis vinifera TaxID=29760 RepID=A0A438CV92_VITVI|nr:Protein DA1-related 1 [Vitis vinifera]